MLAAQEVGLPTVNGWSGRSPPKWNAPPDWKPATTYRALLEWLTVTNTTPPEVLSGLVVFGEPAKDPDPSYDKAMHARYPPQTLR